MRGKHTDLGPAERPEVACTDRQIGTRGGLNVEAEEPR